MNDPKGKRPANPVPKPDPADSETGSSRTIPHSRLQRSKKPFLRKHLSSQVSGLYSSADSLRFARTQERGIFKDMSMDAPLSDLNQYRRNLDSQMYILSLAEGHIKKLSTIARKRKAELTVALGTSLETLLNKDPQVALNLSRRSLTTEEVLPIVSPPTSPPLSAFTAASLSTSQLWSSPETATKTPSSSITMAPRKPARPEQPTTLRRSSAQRSISFLTPPENSGGTAMTPEP